MFIDTKRKTTKKGEYLRHTDSRVSNVCLFATPWTVALQVPLSVGFSRREHWSGLPFPPPGDLPDPGIELSSLTSPASAGRVFTTEPSGRPISCYVLKSDERGSQQSLEMAQIPVAVLLRSHISAFFFCFLTEGSVRFERRALPRSPCRQMKMCELAFRIHDSLIPYWGASLVSFQLIKVHTRRCVCAHTCVCALSCRKTRRSVGTRDTPASRRCTPVINSSLASGQASGTVIF